jgi:organic radical activating enzyme
MNDTLRMVREMPVFATLQGEGILAGMPSTFVRTAGCDLRCARDVTNRTGWSCDTPTSLPDYLPTVGRFTTTPTRFGVDLHVDEVAARVAQTQPSYVVVTGGEPTLQAASVTAMLARVQDQGLLGSRRVHVTLETNGRHYSSDLAQAVDLVSLSPKVYRPEDIDDCALHEWLLDGGPFEIQVKVVLADLSPIARTLVLFEHVRKYRADAYLFVQQADVHPQGRYLRTDKDDNDRNAVLSWVKEDHEARALGVRYGVQMHKHIGIP